MPLPPMWETRLEFQLLALALRHHLGSQSADEIPLFIWLPVQSRENRWGRGTGCSLPGWAGAHRAEPRGWQAPTDTMCGHTYTALERLSRGSGSGGGPSASGMSGCAVGDTDSRTPVT